MVHVNMARPKKYENDSVQTGWRLEGKDAPLISLLTEYAKAHRLSRNSAITVAVEQLLFRWQAELNTTKKAKP